MKAKVGYLENEIMEIFNRYIMKEFTGVVEGFVGKKSFL